MATVVWSDHALCRIREQARYIAERSCSTEIAWKWACDIFDEAKDLADFPNIGHRLPEFPNSPYLEILVRKNFRLIYRIEKASCFIVSVRRSSMLLDEAAIEEFNAV